LKACVVTESHISILLDGNWEIDDSCVSRNYFFLVIVLSILQNEGQGYKTGTPLPCNPITRLKPEHYVALYVVVNIRSSHRKKFISNSVKRINFFLSGHE
jgi:hypothetical protein